MNELLGARILATRSSNSRNLKKITLFLFPLHCVCSRNLTNFSYSELEWCRSLGWGRPDDWWSLRSSIFHFSNMWRHFSNMWRHSAGRYVSVPVGYGYLSVRVPVGTCRYATLRSLGCRFAPQFVILSLRYATLRVGTGTYGYLSVRVATLRFAHSRNKNSVARTKTM